MHWCDDLGKASHLPVPAQTFRHVTDEVSTEAANLSSVELLIFGPGLEYRMFSVPIYPLLWQFQVFHFIEVSAMSLKVFTHAAQNIQVFQHLP